MDWKDKFPKESVYFETSKGILYCGDCLEVIKGFPKGVVDLILTDPPYQISKNHNFDTMPDRKNKRTGTYFGEWDTFNIDDWGKIIPVLSDNGSIISFMSHQQYKDFVDVMSKADVVIKDRLIWEKTNPFPRNRDRRYIPNIELFVWGVKKGGKWIFNRQSEKYETCVFRFPSESGARFKRYHPTQKPLKLLKYLLCIHTNPDDLVLDCFSGSGSALVACEQLNRKWIGIEINKEYCEIAKQRILKEIGGI